MKVDPPRESSVANREKLFYFSAGTPSRIVRVKSLVLSYSAVVGEDHYVGGLDEGGNLFADLESQLVGAFARDQGYHVVVPDPDGDLGRRLALDDLGDGAGEPVTGAHLHPRCLLRL